MNARGATNSQTQANSNGCDNGELTPSSVLCQNTASQIQGDENAASLATNQRSQGGGVGDPNPDVGLLTVNVVVQCPPGLECFDALFFQEWVYSVSEGNGFPRQFFVQPEGGQVTILFLGLLEGPEKFEISQAIFIGPPVDVKSIQVSATGDCHIVRDRGNGRAIIGGVINGADELECTITNEIRG